MAFKDILILSSSPPIHVTTYNMSSSPPLPSPSQLFTKKVPALRAGSRAAPIPQNATASFTSASNLCKVDNLQGTDTVPSFRSVVGVEDALLEANHATRSRQPKPRNCVAGKVEGDEAGDAKARKKPRKATTKKDDAAPPGAELKKPRKPRTKKVNEELREDGVVKEKAPRKSRPKKAEGDCAVGGVTKEKAVRKLRTKKMESDSQTKLPTAQIIKVPTSKVGKDAITSPKEDAGDDPFADSLDYGLVEAVKRRTNWTPPPPTIETKSLTTPPMPVDIVDDGQASGGSKASEQRSKGFQDLFGNFGFKKVGNMTEKAVPDEVGTRKRKLIELIKTNASASTTVVPKAKALKKPRTITQQATSAYTKQDEEPGSPAPLLQYFSFETTDRVAPGGFKVPPKPRSKIAIKCGKGTAKEPILLSPESALKQVGNQDFIFGTSSQLAREESPTFLRDIHAAMQASNVVDDDDPFASSLVQFGGKSTNLSSVKPSLWSASARDESGQLLDVEMVDLSDSPAVARHLHTMSKPKDASSEALKENNKPWHDVEKLVEAPIEKSMTAESIIQTSPKTIGPVEAAIRLKLLSSPSSSMKSSRSPARSPTQSEAISPKSSKSPAGKPLKPNKSKILEKPMPDFSAYTMSQLIKQVAAYHFKPVKSREQMITLLGKCWEADQNRRKEAENKSKGAEQQATQALATRDANLPMSFPKKITKGSNEAPASSQAQAASPKRLRGRPKKGGASSSPIRQRTKTASLASALSRAKKAQKKAEVLDEISDSDTAPTPSPPRRCPSQIGTPPLPLQLSSSSSVDTRELSPTSLQIRLFKHITAAVKGASASTDSSNPSWHEKILLYDPIILEDLTVWLNSGALEKAGWDGEVDPKEVKKWCESKSICCLWKENLRGETRSRY